MNHNKYIQCEIAKTGIATLSLNNPKKHNAFDDKIISSLINILYNLRKNGKVKVLILRANGKSFSAGGDLNWMKKMAGYTWKENIADAKELGRLMYTLYHFGKPTIALVQGAAFGGGAGLVACCQIAIASKKAKFCFSETKLGLIPAVIGPYIIKAIGPRLTKAYFMNAEIFSAQRAYEMGLCLEVVDREDDLNKRGLAIANSLLKNGPNALKEVSLLVDSLQNLAINEETINITAQKIASIRATDEAQEGLSAFLEKRQPSWSKRENND